MLPKLKGQVRLQTSTPTAMRSPSVGGTILGGSITPPATYSLRRKRDTRLWLRPRECRQLSPQDDTSLSSLKRRSQSISTCLKRYRTQRLETVRVVQTRERKKKLAKLLRRHYGVKFNLCEVNRLSMDRMIQRAAEKRAWTLAREAAKRMVRWLGRVRLSRGIHEVTAREHMSAFLIQQHWRRYQSSVLQPRAKAEAQTQAALIIQRCFRGYAARLKTLKLRALRQVNALHFHCERIRMRSIIERAPVILRTWQKYRRRKQDAARRKAEESAVSVVEPAVPPKGDRPSRITITPPNMRKMKSESYAPRSPLSRTPITRKRSQTDASLPAKRQSPKPRATRKELSPEEPKTAPMHLQSRVRHPMGHDLERIEEIS